VASPVIGVTAYVERARWGAWDVPAVLVPYDYVRMLEAAGARPLVVPPSTDAVEETLDVLDGLLISGGPDLDPALYGADAHEATDEPRTARDAGELALLTAALERDLPVLAVCRGSQLLNVARGGDLVQHLPETIGHEGHKHEPGTFSEHGVEVKAGTRLGSLVGGHAPVHSHHHQGFGRVGEGLVETAWADDGSLEGIEDPTRRFALGVLWHPEAGEDTALFEALVDEARRYRAERSAA